MESQNNQIPILSIEEIMKIDISIAQNDMQLIRSIFDGIDTKFHLKVLMLCAFIMNVESKEVIATNLGKASKRSRNIFLARSMWLKILKDEYNQTFKEMAAFSSLTPQNVQKSIFEFEKKLQHSCVLNKKYEMVIKILNK